MSSIEIVESSQLSVHWLRRIMTERQKNIKKKQLYLAPPQIIIAMSYITPIDIIEVICHLICLALKKSMALALGSLESLSKEGNISFTPLGTSAVAKW